MERLIPHRGENPSSSRCWERECAQKLNTVRKGNPKKSQPKGTFPPCMFHGKFPTAHKSAEHDPEGEEHGPDPTCGDFQELCRGEEHMEISALLLAPFIPPGPGCSIPGEPFPVASPGGGILLEPLCPFPASSMPGPRCQPQRSRAQGGARVRRACVPTRSTSIW